MPSQARSLPVVALVSVCGCSPTTLFPLPEEPVGGVVSWIVAVQTGVSAGWEVAASPQGTVVRLDAAGEPTAVLRFGYPASLAELGLTEGRIEADTGCGRSCTLLTPQVAQQARLRDRRWEDGALISDDLARHLVFAKDQRCRASCPSLTVVEVALPGEEALAFLLEYDDRSALFGMAGGDLKLVDLDGQVTSLCHLTGVVPMDAARGAGDALWLSVGDGRVLRLDATKLSAAVECPVEETLPRPGGSYATRIVASPSPATELFAITSTGAFVRYDGARWEVLALFTVDPSETPRGDLVWLGANRAAAVRDTPEVVEWDGGMSYRSLPVGSVGNTVHALARLPGDELAVIVSRLGVYHSQGGAWILSFHSGLEGLEALKLWDGMLLLTSKDALEAHHDELGPCGLLNLRGKTLRSIAAIGRRGFVVSDHGHGSVVGNQLYAVKDQRACRGE